MANDKITISEILSIKGGSVEEFCQYALGKGITLPSDPNYALSPSELNVIDPTLSYKLKFNKSLSATTKSKENVREDASTSVAEGVDSLKS